MGVDTSTYRCRIGTYFGKPFKPRGKKYNPYTDATDIQYRMLITCVYLLFLSNCFYRSICIVEHCRGHALWYMYGCLHNAVQWGIDTAYSTTNFNLEELYYCYQTMWKAILVLVLWTWNKVLAAIKESVSNEDWTETYQIRVEYN